MYKTQGGGRKALNVIWSKKKKETVVEDSLLYLFIILFLSHHSNLNKSIRGFPGGSDDKESAWNAGDPGSISGSGRPPGKGNVNPLQYSCLQNSMDRVVWQVIVYGVTQSIRGQRKKD